MACGVRSALRLLSHNLSVLRPRESPHIPFFFGGIKGLAVALRLRTLLEYEQTRSGLRLPA